MADMLTERDEKQIAALLVGHRVEQVSDDTLLLDDGTRLTVTGNDGCGWCASGNYKIDALNGFDNVITRVKVVEQTKDTGGEDEHVYSIFVYAGQKAQKHTLLSASGDDGNGYYGTGFEIRVAPAG